MLFGGLMMILFLGAIIVLIVVLVRWLSGHTGQQHFGGPAHKMPLDILKERFARGEIDEEEFEKRRKRLSD